MKKNYLIIAGLFALVIVSCGGGGSSGGGGVTEVDTSQYYRDAVPGDEVAFKVTATNVSSVTTINYEKSVFSQVDVLLYPFAEAPDEPYLLETITESDEEDLDPADPYGSIYYAPNGDEVESVEIGTEYTNVTDIESDEPETVVIGQTYTATLTETVYSLVPGNEGDPLGTRTITAEMQLVGTESVTVPAGTYNAMKLHVTSTLDEYDGSTVINSIGDMWYGENKDLIKSDITFTQEGGSGSARVVNELLSRSDASSSLLAAGSFQSPNLSSGTSMRHFLRGFVAASKSLSLH